MSGRLPNSPSGVLSLAHFAPGLVHDANLRDALRTFFEACAVRENSLDRVDDQHSIDYQRGKVAAFRWLTERIRELDTHREGENDGPIR